jgi:hypothetical protein
MAARLTRKLKEDDRDKLRVPCRDERERLRTASPTVLMTARKYA